MAHRFLDEGDLGDLVSPPTGFTEAQILDRLEEGDLVGIVNVASSKGTATVMTPPVEADIAAVAPSTTIEGVSAAERCADAADVTDAEDIDELAILQVGAFTGDDPDPCECDNYNVNCKNFGDIDRSVYPYDRDLELNDVAHWRVSASYDGHPFHIHINPYLVCPGDDNVYDPIPFPHWRDTYLVNLDRRVDMITQYRAFTGDFVFHCHKLTHEDDGMMQLLRVCDPATDPSCGDNDWRTCADGDLECAQALAATECAIESDDPLETFACITALGLPGEVCSPAACASDDDCAFPTPRCVDWACVP